MLQNTVGQRLKLARKIAGISGESLGEAIGVSKGQISNIERGTSDLTKSNALVLCEKLGIRPNWLLTGEGEMKEGGGPSQSVSVGRIKGDQNLAGFGNQTNQGGEDLKAKLSAVETENQHLWALLKEKDERIQELKERIQELKERG